MQESLAGRVCLLSMSTLSQAEISGVSTRPFQLDLDALTSRSKEIELIDTPKLFERIFNGGMPSLISGEYTDRRVVYSNYISTYIDRDVKELSGIINSLKFFNFITAVAALCGQMINYKTIADACEIDQTRVRDWLGILETLGIIFYLHPYSNNVLKRTISKPKLYFYDSGLVAYLTKWSDGDTLMNGAMSGAIFENYVVSEIIKSYHNSGLEPFIYYYRDKDAKEIDIIMEKDGKLHPMEIKKTASPGSQLIKVFSVIEKSTLIRSTGAVLCTSAAIDFLLMIVITSLYL